MHRQTDTLNEQQILELLNRRAVDQLTSDMVNAGRRSTDKAAEQERRAVGHGQSTCAPWMDQAYSVDDRAILARIIEVHA